MSFVSIGDLSSGYRLQYHNAALRRQADKLALELASGRRTDIAAANRGDMAGLSAVSRALEVIGTYQTVLQETDTRATVVQDALGLIQGMAQTSGPEFHVSATSGSNPSVSTSGDNALANLSAVIGATNFQVAGQFLFSGQAVDTAPLADANAILDRLETLTGGATTAADVSAIVSDFFNISGGGFDTDIYQGSDTATGPTRISDSEVADLTVSAASPEIRGALEGFAKAALISRGVLAGDVSEQAKLLGFAGQTLSRAAAGLVDTQARIGSVQQRIDTVRAQNAAGHTAAQIMMNDLTTADPYVTATNLQAVEGQLEALYIATSRLAQLSLTRYLG